ncbi:MAG: succinyl-diaminopimelate desuccinylase [Halobacteriales archaeon]
MVLIGYPDIVEAEHGLETAFEKIQRYEPAGVPADSAVAERLRELPVQGHEAVESPLGIEAATNVRNVANEAEMEAIR